MPYMVRAGLRVIMAAAALACSGDEISAPADRAEPPAELLSSPPQGTMVSDPFALTSRSFGASIESSTPSEGTFAYVSAAPGTFPDAAGLDVINITHPGATETRGVIDGGFDPVRIAAQEG